MSSFSNTPYWFFPCPAVVVPVGTGKYCICKLLIFHFKLRGMTWKMSGDYIKCIEIYQ